MREGLLKLQDIKAKTKDPIFQTGPTASSESKNFLDVTSELGLDKIRAVKLYAVDFDGDKYTDLIVLPGHYSHPKFYRFRPKKKKFELLDYSPFSKSFRASFLVFYDRNKDGVQDILFATLNQRTELTKRPLKFFYGEMKNNKIYYKDGGSIDPRTFPISSLSLIDYDLDGHLDLFQGHWYAHTKEKTKILPDRLYRYNGSAFSETSEALENEHEFKKSLGLFPNAVPTFSSSVCDMDQDGWPDLLTSSSAGHVNKLWFNRAKPNGGRKFQHAGTRGEFAQDSVGVLNPKGGGNTFISLCLDYNRDSFIDVYMGEVATQFDPESRDRSAILTRDVPTLPARFIRTEVDRSEGGRPLNQGDRRAVVIDYNNDGLDDLLVDNSGFPPDSRMILFKQFDDHSYDDFAPKLGIDFLNPSGSIVMDFNRDGKMDIISGQTSLRDSRVPNRIYAFKNNIARKKNRSLRVYLSGKMSNLKGLGATIKVVTDKFESRRMVDYSYGPQPSQNEEGIHFGLGAKNKLKWIEVTWPYINPKGRWPKKVRRVRYPVGTLSFNFHVDLTLCEMGHWKVGRKSCPKVK